VNRPLCGSSVINKNFSICFGHATESIKASSNFNNIKHALMPKFTYASHCFQISSAYHILNDNYVSNVNYRTLMSNEYFDVEDVVEVECLVEIYNNYDNNY